MTHHAAHLFGAIRSRQKEFFSAAKELVRQLLDHAWLSDQGGVSSTPNIKLDHWTLVHAVQTLDQVAAVLSIMAYDQGFFGAVRSEILSTARELVCFADY